MRPLQAGVDGGDSVTVVGARPVTGDGADRAVRGDPADPMVVGVYEVQAAVRTVFGIAWLIDFRVDGQASVTGESADAVSRDRVDDAVPIDVSIRGLNDRHPESGNGRR